jgi:hypothetical protein
MKTKPRAPRGKYNIDTYTMEEYLEIKKHNKEVLDRIFSDDDWVVNLAKKWYGDRWTMLIDKHPDKTEIVKAKQNQNTKNVKLRKEGTWVRTNIPDTQKPLIQYDLEGNEVARWDTVHHWCKETGSGKDKVVSVMACTFRGQETAYGYIWKVDEHRLEEYYQQKEEQFYKELNDE